MNSLSRQNHYVSRSLLERWSNDGAFLNAYRLLVSDERVPQWTRQSIRGASCQADLYTEFDGTRDVDDVERELGRVYEEPALEVIDALIDNRRVTPAGWRSLTDFFALQAMRTPRAFISFAERAERHLGEALEESVNAAEEMLANMSRAAAAGAPSAAESAARPPASEYFKGVLRVKFEESGDGRALARAVVRSPRSLWSARNRHVLQQGAAEVLRGHRWSIAEANDNLEWPITDHPAVTLHFSSTSDYMLGGGWGKQNTDLFMPLSPKKLLFVEVGKKFDNRFTFTAEQTRFLQRVLVENAHRVVFLRNPEPWPAAVRPRVVDPQAYQNEQDTWKRWNDFNRNLEAAFDGLNV